MVPILFRGYRALRAQPPAAVAVMASPSSDCWADLVPITNANGLPPSVGGSDGACFPGDVARALLTPTVATGMALPSHRQNHERRSQ